MAAMNTAEPDLRTYLQILRRRYYWVIAAVVLLGAAAGGNQRVVIVSSDLRRPRLGVFAKLLQRSLETVVVNVRDMFVGCWDLMAERSASLVIRAFGTRHCDGRLEGRGPRALHL